VIVLKGKGVFRLFDKDIVMEPIIHFLSEECASFSQADEDLSMVCALRTDGVLQQFLSIGYDILAMRFVLVYYAYLSWRRSAL